MKQCIAITETLTKIVVVDTGNTETDNLEAAIECVKEAYCKQKIILNADDLVPDRETGEPAFFCEADWIDAEEIQKMKADFAL